MSRGEIRITLSQEIFSEVQTLARQRCMPVTGFVQEVIEAVAATKRLDSLPPPEPVRTRPPRHSLVWLCRPEVK